MKHLSIIYLLLLIILSGCVKPYDFNTETFERVLVVDGYITDGAGPYEVTLSYTYELDTIINEYETDASVWVETGSGDRVDYSHYERGIYQSPDGFQGISGESYQLFVELSNGSVYQSSEEVLTPSPDFSRIYQRYEELPDEDGGEIVGGIQFFLDVNDPTGQARFFRYEWEEGYQINVPYPARYEVLPDSSIIPLEVEIGLCFSESSSDGLIFGSTIGNRDNQLKEFPIRFIGEGLHNQQLRVRYSILVKQYAISESAYLFYKRLQENNDSGGSLFDQQVGSIFGNISSVTEPGEGVLGFFEVAGVTSKRTFFYAGELDPRYSPPPYLYFCSPSFLIETTQDSALYYAPPGSAYNIVNLTPVSNPETGAIDTLISVHTQVCTDCSFYADTTQPPYWIP